MAVESNTHHYYFTKFSRKSLDFVCFRWDPPRKVIRATNITPICANTHMQEHLHSNTYDWSITVQQLYVKSYIYIYMAIGHPVFDFNGSPLVPFCHVCWQAFKVKLLGPCRLTLTYWVEWATAINKYRCKEVLCKKHFWFIQLYSNPKLRVISLEMLQIYMPAMRLKITYLNLDPRLPGPNIVRWTTISHCYWPSL